MIPITISNQTHVSNGSFMYCCLAIMSSSLCKLLGGTLLQLHEEKKADGVTVKSLPFYDNEFALLVLQPDTL